MQNKNRILISVNEDTKEPDWFENVEPFINKVMNELNYSGQEVMQIIFQMTKLKRQLIFAIFIRLKSI